MYGMTKEQEEELSQADKEWQKEQEEQIKKDNDLLESLKPLLTFEQIADLWDEIKESGDWGNLSIVDEPKGQNQDLKSSITLFVNQTTNGGYSGDDFAGACYAALPNGKYLRWEYSC